MPVKTRGGCEIPLKLARAVNHRTRVQGTELGASGEHNHLTADNPPSPRLTVSVTQLPCCSGACGKSELHGRDHVVWPRENRERQERKGRNIKGPPPTTSLPPTGLRLRKLSGPQFQGLCKPPRLARALSGGSIHGALFYRPSNRHAQG